MTIEKASEDLRSLGYCVIPKFLDSNQIEILSQDIDILFNAGQFRPAGVGKTLQHASDVRRDQIYWLNPLDTHPVRQTLNLKIESLRRSLNEKFFLGLFDFEIHYAIYDEGAFYKRHQDVFNSDDSRALSMVLYLNNSWESSHGGELILYPKGFGGSGLQEPEPKGTTDKEITIAPLGGTLVFFLSTMEHEVKESHRRRKSCTGWFLRRPRPQQY